MLSEGVWVIVCSSSFGSVVEICETELTPPMTEPSFVSCPAFWISKIVWS
jgi:hypothetical protein